MNLKERNELQNTLESLVDKYSLRQIVRLLAEVAHLKADHVRTNWQDELLAEDWTVNGDMLDELQRNIIG